MKLELRMHLGKFVNIMDLRPIHNECNRIVSYGWIYFYYIQCDAYIIYVVFLYKIAVFALTTYCVVCQTCPAARALGASIRLSHPNKYVKHKPELSQPDLKQIQ